MRIAVNTRFLLKDKLEGIGWFTYESLKHITIAHPEHEFIFLFDRPYAREFIFADNITPVVLFPPARHPFLWYVWFEMAVPKALKKYKPDVFLSTDGYLSLKADCKQVLVVHDLAFEHFSNHLNGLALKYYRHFTPRYVKKASRIATVSDYTKKDICETYHVPPEKIDVVYNGSNARFKPLGKTEQQQVRGQYSAGHPYFIYAGAIQPRKNISNLFLAFDIFKATDKLGHKLIIAGRKAWETDEAMETHADMKHKDDVIFLGHLKQEELSQLMASSEALVYVSLFEGFGIPIVEAMSCDVPVITSNISSMPEVAGKAGILVDPYSKEEIAAAMHTITSDFGLREKLIEEGRKQRTKFSWQQTGERLWETMMKVV
jgi:glycosyltransferase involved in cell wall biosynthesis